MRTRQPRLQRGWYIHAQAVAAGVLHPPARQLAASATTRTRRSSSRPNVPRLRTHDRRLRDARTSQNSGGVHRPI